jgi:hypothetical protein
MLDRRSQAIRFTRTRLLSGLLGVVLATQTGSAASADEILHYANTCVEQESGDVAGYVVTVSDGVPLPSISLSWSEGALMMPVTAKITDYDRASGRLAFSVQVDDASFLFEGRIERQRIEGIIKSPWRTGPDHVRLELRSRKAAIETPKKCR